VPRHEHAYGRVRRSPAGQEAPAGGPGHRPPWDPHAGLLRPAAHDHLLAGNAPQGGPRHLRRQGEGVQLGTAAGAPRLRHPGRRRSDHRRGPAQPGHGLGVARRAGGYLPGVRPAADLGDRPVRRSRPRPAAGDRGPAAGVDPPPAGPARPRGRLPRDPPTAGPGRHRPRARTAAVRRGLRHAADDGPPARRRRRTRSRPPTAAGRWPAGRFRRSAPVHPDRRAARGQRGADVRARPTAPDAAAVAG
jgi:hypothetical protein